MRQATLISLLSITSLFGADNTLTKKEKADGWILLFDGKTLDGWDSASPQTGGGRRGGGGGGGGGGQQGRGAAQPGAAAAVGSNPRSCSAQTDSTAAATGSHWEVVNGTLSPCGEPTGYLSTKETYKDFVLQVDFKTGEDTNSGVFIHAPANALGYEVQIWKTQPAGFNTGSIVGVAKTDGEFKFNPDQWNHYEITADGDHLIVALNGTTTLDAHDSKFPDGVIRLQYQKYPIDFKNIKLKPITH